MAVVTPPTISTLPAAPDPNDRATFNARAYPWAAAQAVLATEVNAVASNVATNATDAQTSANTATDKAALTADDRAQSGLDRTSVAGDAASILTMDKRYLGSKTSAPTLDNQGAALSIGAVYYDTVLAKVRTWNGTAWVEGISSVSGVSSVNGLTGAVTLALLRNVSYASRSSLRFLSPAQGDAAVVEGLGLFLWESASTEPDDDESAFVTASGVWLLQAASWDLVDSWQLPDDSARDEDDEDEPLRFRVLFSTKVITGSIACSVLSVGAGAKASFSGSLIGAAIGDCVVATPPALVGSTASGEGYLSYQAWVSATNTVSIAFMNSSASNSATTNPLVRAPWAIAVIKS